MLNQNVQEKLKLNVVAAFLLVEVIEKMALI